MKQLFSVWFIFVGAVFAQTQPVWWNGIYENGIAPAPGFEAHGAVANVGQLKNTALEAKNYLDAHLALKMVNAETAWRKAYGNYPNPFDTIEDGNNYSPATVLELKFFAYGVYRLLAQEFAEYDVRRGFMLTGLRPGLFSERDGAVVPWSEAALLSENQAPINIGQLKSVFAFDLDYDVSSVGDPYKVVGVDEDSDLLTAVIESLASTNSAEYTSASDIDSLNDNASITEAVDTSGIVSGLTIIVPEKGIFRADKANLELKKM